MAFHDLTTTLQPTYNLLPLLGLGSKFIPTPLFTHGARDLATPGDLTSTMFQFERALRILCFFADQGDTDEDEVDQYNPRMYIPSNWYPPQHTFPRIVQQRLDLFMSRILRLYKCRRSHNNLLPYQRRALRWLRTQDDFVIASCDKNLGPCILEKTQYISRVRGLLSNREAYLRLSEAEAHLQVGNLRTALHDWLHDYKHKLPKNEYAFLARHLKNCQHPFGAFYILLKIHKTPIAERPVVSFSGSLLHALATWCDSKLQPLAQAQRSYIKSSEELKNLLCAFDLPPNAKFFTADARSMYTNIPTDECLDIIQNYLASHLDEFQHVDHHMLHRALRLVMKGNYFTFGDTYWWQRNGAAMGAPPCPAWATLYFAAHEDNCCDLFNDEVICYKRYIDDVIGIWLCQPYDNQRWDAFKNQLNDASALDWDFTDRSRSVNFLDLTFTVENNGLIRTNLYEKPMNLHMYLPPHSAHPPGVLRGLIYGMVGRIYRLCSEPSDRDAHLHKFYRHLLHRGHKPPKVLPIFTSAIHSIMNPPEPALQQQVSSRPMLFKLEYHPEDPPSHALQHIWRTTLSKPPFSRPLATLLSSHRVNPIGVSRMIVCYKRPPNLENLVSSKRNITFKNGPPVSSFFD
jgi:hypothetical protein